MIKITGKIKKIFPTIQKPQSEGFFFKRMFWLEEVAEKYANTWCLETWKMPDCDMLDSYKVGDYVTCYIDIKGQYWKKDDKESVTNTLKCWNIEKEGKLFRKLN